MTKNYCVLVLGMHRSGTSALTRHILDKGFSLGSVSLPPHPEDNPGGYWESPETVKLNNKFMEEIGSNWKDVTPFPSHCFSSAIATRYRVFINTLLQSTFRHENQIVIKDPRMCRLLPLWLPVLKDYCHHVSVVFITRQAQAVFRSLASRVHFEDIAGGAIVDRHHASLLWLRHNLEAEFASRDLKRLILSYEKWLKSPVKETKKIHRFLRKSLPGSVIDRVKPTLYAPRQEADRITTPQDDLERINQQTYTALLGKDRGGFLDKLRENASICIPSLHQDEVPPPPPEITAKAQLKHICGITPSNVGMPGNLAPNQKTQEETIVFISDEANSRSHIYRVKNAVDALNNNGRQAYWVTSASAARQLKSLLGARLVIIHRSSWNKDIAAIYRFCNKHQIRTAFDIDDLIFEPGIIESGQIHFISQLEEKRQLGWQNIVKHINKSLLAADFCITSTQTIATHVLQQGKQAVCIPNGFSEENFMLASHWREQHRQVTSGPRVGYASGTATHAADFAIIAEPVADFLNRHPDWKFTVIGRLDLSPYSDLFDETRIEQRPLVPHINLAYELARLDINLIPLARNPFCDAKSSLKYYEAALCGVPSIATNNPMYIRLFGEGGSGLLASSANEWRKHLKRLAGNKERRLKLAEKALQQCSERYSPHETAKMYRMLN